VTRKTELAIRPKLRLVQQAQALAQHPEIKIVYSGTTGIFGTVAANITALTTLQAHANTSAQNLILLDCQSFLIYSQALPAPIKIKSIIHIPILI
jgi:poly(A) polymerase Pap1